MGKRGPKSTPTALRVLHGNPDRRPLPVEPVEGVGVLWKPPEWMDDAQRAQWHYAVERAPPGLLTETDREVLAVWVVAAVEHARAVREVRRGGQVVKTKDGNVIQNPYLPIVNKQALLMLRAGAEMGFSPAARAALGNSAPEFTHGSTGDAARPRSPQLAAYLAAKPDNLN